MVCVKRVAINPQNQFQQIMPFRTRPKTSMSNCLGTHNLCDAQFASLCRILFASALENKLTVLDSGRSCNQYKQHLRSKMRSPNKRRNSRSGMSNAHEHMFVELRDGQGWKVCPHCKATVAKTEGCKSPGSTLHGKNFFGL